MIRKFVNTPDVNSCDFVIVGMGANLASDVGGPAETLNAALEAMPAAGINIVRRSPWYRTQPVPVSNQDWFVNGVAIVETALTAPALLAALHAIEARFGRRRSVANAARVLDLDLLAYGRLQVCDDPALQLPHPRLQARAFVLLPLADVAPDWCHPSSGLSLDALRAAMPGGQVVERLN